MAQKYVIEFPADFVLGAEDEVVIRRVSESTATDELSVDAETGEQTRSTVQRSESKLDTRRSASRRMAALRAEGEAALTDELDKITREALKSETGARVLEAAGLQELRFEAVTSAEASGQVVLRVPAQSKLGEVDDSLLEALIREAADEVARAEHVGGARELVLDSVIDGEVAAAAWIKWPRLCEKKEKKPRPVEF